MKKIMKLISVSGIILFFILSACSKNNMKFLRDFSYSGCKSHEKSLVTNQTSDDKEVIEIKSKRGYLYFKHKNVYFNCEPGKIIAKASLKDTVITISENEQQHVANCICPYDLSFKIGPLARGKYTVIINLLDDEYASFVIDFTTSVDTIININSK